MYAHSAKGPDIINIWWASKSGTVAFVDSNGWCSLWFSSSYMVNPIWQKGACSHFILKDTMVGSDASLNWNQRCFFLSKIWVPVFLPTTWTLEITSLLPSRGCARHGLIHPTTWSLIQAGLSSLATAAAGLELCRWWLPLPSSVAILEGKNDKPRFPGGIFLEHHIWYDKCYVNLTSSSNWCSVLHIFSVEDWTVIWWCPNGWGWIVWCFSLQSWFHHLMPRVFGVSK